MGKRRFLTFLGTTHYGEARYAWQSVISPPTRFVQEAIVSLVGGATPFDEVVVFHTREAGARNGEWHKCPQCDGYEGLFPRLRRLAQQHGFDLTLVELPDRARQEETAVDQVLSRDEQNVWETVQLVYDRLYPGDEVYFDITHSFRYQPMLAAQVLYYAEISKDITVKGLYYGFYDKDNEINLLFDASAFLKMQKWVMHLDLFLKSGRAEALKKFVDSLTASYARHEEHKDVAVLLKKVASSLHRLSRGLYSSNLMRIHEEAQAARDEMRRVLEIERKRIPLPFQPFLYPLTKLEAEIASICGEDVQETALRAIAWLRGKHLYQQAATIAVELFLDWLTPLLFPHVRRGSMSHGERMQVENLVRQIAKAALAAQEGEFVERIKRVLDQWTGTALGDLQQVVASLRANKRLLYYYDKVRVVRNAMNHASRIPDRALPDEVKKDPLKFDNYAGQILQEFEKAFAARQPVTGVPV